ncbi:YciI family protein [Achromobacter seleniivolatilans]|uniref:YciI family protein n=1 Tax=Achromobacter seleniivolatilans TaxID=3047478 RepID=A0ABY9M416_9BURK|nr:YciI family protein [Achromobacter sp. R39]WMD21744.1 YciI family protein [Achromobacter sp. R39]
MRYMIIVRATPDSESGIMPEESMLASMATYHEALAKAGVLLDANGLQPSSKGWRVQYDHGQRKVIDGPFADTKELIAGYTMIQVRSREEAMQWALRFPEPFTNQPCEVEVRQLFELEDFGPSQAVERFRDIPGVAR